MAKAKTIGTFVIRALPGKDPSYTAPKGIKPDMRGKPCPSERKGCSVQLVFKPDGAYLRFCLAKNKPGRMVKVTSPADAMRVSQKICACWAKKKSFSSCVPADAALGRTRRRR